MELGPVLTPLLGYGHGLTPSGDDFLLGILFALEWTAFQGRDEFIAALLPLLTRTTEISAVMLKMGGSRPLWRAFTAVGDSPRTRCCQRN
ncbi:oxamate carbamoyltransferase subunit AllH family protein [Aeromonas veronii]|uniref:oxamate carbamoyltransferase subunit AllH family protein n=1 Tax=Aeromonas veronii TaxID=654 RepID=UPI003DA5AC3A